MAEISLPAGGRHPGSSGYEKLRCRYFNARLPSHEPAGIYTPKTTQEVAEIVKYARAQKLKVGVRSGGHLFPATSLIHDGILIDCQSLNRQITYNPTSHVISFSPGSNAAEISEYLTNVDRFFPFGHDPTVGIGGFLLAGGQGWFMRECGYTGPGWVTQLEIVLSSGVTILADPQHNDDIFWAARGSGQGFFAVVTRIWAKTIPARKLFQSRSVFNISEIFRPFLVQTLKICDQLPKEGLDISLITFHPGEGSTSDSDNVHDFRIFLAINSMVYANSFEQAKSRVLLFNTLSLEFSDYLVDTLPLTATTWDKLWPGLSAMVPSGHGERWLVDSILPSPDTPYDQLVDTIKSAIYDLPTQKTVGTICLCHYDPDPKVSAVSIPHKYYVSTMVCWRNPGLELKLREWLRGAYRQTGKISIGMYIADYDVSQRQERVMTNDALKRWIRIRRKYDAEEVFVGHKGFSSILQSGTLEKT